MKNIFKDKGRVENENIDLDENAENGNVIPKQLNEDSASSGENNEMDFENVSFSGFDQNKLVANLFIYLGEVYGTTTETSCFVSERAKHIL